MPSLAWTLLGCGAGQERQDDRIVVVARRTSRDRYRDAEVTTQLANYKALDACWQDWSAVKVVLADLAERMTR